jgi:hypothetical protein
LNGRSPQLLLCLHFAAVHCDHFMAWFKNVSKRVTLLSEGFGKPSDKGGTAQGTRPPAHLAPPSLYLELSSRCALALAPCARSATGPLVNEGPFFHLK